MKFGLIGQLKGDTAAEAQELLQVPTVCSTVLSAPLHAQLSFVQAVRKGVLEETHL